MTTPLKTILDSFKAAKSAINLAINKWGYEVNSSGTKDLALTYTLDTSIGYWATNASVLSKPPRWILHLRRVAGKLIAEIAKDPTGTPLGSAGTPGYINNRDGKSVVAMFRIMPAVATGASASGAFVFPSDWEWIVVVAFSKPLPAGTSGETLANFNPIAGTFDYKGNINPSKVAYKASCLALVTSSALGTASSANAGGSAAAYLEATQAIAAYLGSGGTPVIVCDPNQSAQLTSLASSVSSAIASQPVAAAQAPAQSSVTPVAGLVGIPDQVYDLINAALAIKKRHFIFYGPPGTAKTTLAEHVADQLSDNCSGFVELTASASWSSQDLIGGYQPMGPGKIGFVPGALLRDFDKPMIIDELNRCPIDKVIGPLFSVLAGQPSTLPYRVDVTDSASDFYKILPDMPMGNLASNEFAPGPAWSLICTLNQVDKTQLGQVSYALSRRFTWIRIGVPVDLNEFVVEMLDKHVRPKGPNDMSLPNPVADMWRAVNRTREIGGAPIIDFIRLVAQMRPDIDMLANPASVPKVQDLYILALGASVLPLLDGIRRMEAEDLAEAISVAWKLDPDQRRTLTSSILDLAL